ncbi:hypothetical protein ACVW01_001279 [Thermostichus sp. MS-CIW-19]|jgi:hypothetical protein
MFSSVQRKCISYLSRRYFGIVLTLGPHDLIRFSAQAPDWALVLPLPLWLAHQGTPLALGSLRASPARESDRLHPFRQLRRYLLDPCVGANLILILGIPGGG